MKKILLLLIAIFPLFIFGNVNATIKTIPEPVLVESMRSSNNENEYYEVKTPMDEDSIVYVSGKTKVPTVRFAIRISKHKSGTYSTTTFVDPDENGEFSVMINTAEGNYDDPEVIDDKGYVVPSSDTYGSTPGYNAVEAMEPGIYHLTIARATTEEDADVSRGAKWWNGPLGASDGVYAYKDFLLLVTENNNPKLISYSDVISNNSTWQNKYESTTGMIDTYDGSYVRYKDTYLRDIAFVLKNPKTGVTTSMNTTKVNYIKSLADDLLTGIAGDYQKVEKIYEYVSGNFYYDRLAYEQGKNQFANPYLNLYNHENKIASDNSDNKGRVATTCQGYASMVVALARSQGIPARLARGFHISNPITIYQDKKASDLTEVSHWWAEVYVNGKWIVVDANAGTNSRWTRTSFTSSGEWVLPGTSTYAGFDPTMDVLSNTYIYLSIYQGANFTKFISYADEFNKLKTFFNKKYSGVTNGKRLNSKYVQDNPSTWASLTTLKTNGFGKVSYINWTGKSVYGALDVSNFTALTYLGVGSNKLTSLNVNNCSSLTNVQAYSNNITTFDGTKASKLATINLNSNKLIKAVFKDGTKTVTIKRNITAGSFSFKYYKANKTRLTITANTTPKGYKYLGIYRGSTRLTTKKSYTFNPINATYYVKYKKI